MRIVFVHGACVADGEWWWHRMTPLLEEHGVTSVAAALPSCGETGMTPGFSGPGLVEDAAALRKVLLDGDETTIVVAHSYGGIVAAEAASGIEAVRHVVLVSSYLPEIGQSLSDFGGPDPAPFLDADLEAGTFTVRPDLLVETFLQDCDSDAQSQAFDHLANQSLTVTAQPVSAAAWKDVATTYLVCVDDRGTPAASQREFARKADTVIELAAGHHPFLSQPEAVRDILLTLR